jgi:hypothetical protein
MRLALFLTVALCLCGCSSTASGINPQTMNGNGQPTSSSARSATGSTPFAIAGEVAKDGRIIHGSGFRVSLIYSGEYEIDVRPSILHGCAAMMITPIYCYGTNQAVFSETRQRNFCKPTFYVGLFASGNGIQLNHGFQFLIAPCQ